jgi:hypothetical protein
MSYVVGDDVPGALESELIYEARHHQEESGLAPVYDAGTGQVVHVTPAEAMAGQVRYARSLGEPSPAAAVGIRHALAFGREHGLVP